MHIEELRRMSRGREPVIPGVRIDEGGPGQSAQRASQNTPADKSRGGDISVAIAGFSSNSINPFYDKNTISDKSLIDDIADRAESFSDAQTMKQELSMAASGVSDQDIAQLKEEGYSPMDLDAEGFRTVTDQIKEQLVKGKVDMGAMENLSAEQIDEIPGGREAYRMAMELSENPLISEDGMEAAPAEYLVTNDLPPTVENVYQAVYSVPPSADVRGAEVDVQALENEIKKVIDAANLPADQPVFDEAEELLSKEIPLTADNLSYFNELTTSQYDLSAEAVQASIENAVSEGREAREAYLLPGYSFEDVAAEALEAVNAAFPDDILAAIKPDGNISISDLETVQVRNERGLDTPAVFSESSEEALRARRVMEEARLVMTYQANLSLLKRGVSIDTKDIAELVEELRFEEQAFYRATLSNGDEADSSDTGLSLEQRIEIYEQTNSQVTELKDLPAALLGRIPDAAGATIGDMVTAGRETRARFEAAGERYEAMATEVRRDLGDSIRKAFGNISELLEDIGMETTEGNERAVRILAYNRREITVSSVLEMKNADEMVSRAFKNMTPGVVAKMIKAGENPLDLGIEKLNERAIEIKNESSMGSDEEKFSEFLWKAEQANEISQEERDAFIGIYRLIYQVEKTDGAVIGQLLGQGAEITLRNMMSAVRTKRSFGGEYTVDDGTERFESRRTELTITEQIEKAFMTERMRDAGEAMTPGRMQQFENTDQFMNMNPDQFASALERMEITAADEALDQEYGSQTAESIRTAIESEQRIYDILSRFDVPTSPANLEAINQMLQNRNGMFTRLFDGGKRKTFGDGSDVDAAENMEIADVKEDIMEAFGEAVKTPEDMAEAQRKLEEIATNVMRDFLAGQRIRYADAHGMRLSINQIKAAGEMGRRSETYAVPIMVADEMGNMSLKIVRGKEPERGAVDVALQMDSIGKVSMSLSVSESMVSGSVSADRRETLEMLVRHEETIASAVGIENVSIEYGVKAEIDTNAIYDKTDKDYDFPVADRGDEKPQIQTKTLYNIARSLIDAVAALGREG